MSTAATTNAIPRAPKVGVTTILFVLVLLAVAAWLRLFSVSPESYDLKPRPDALEYAVGAQRIVTGGTYALDLGGVSLPPRYPPGTSLLFAPFVAFGGAQHAWYGACVFGLLAVFFCALLGHLVAGTPGLIAAGTLLAVSPAAVSSSTLAMSESASTWLASIALLAAALLNWRVKDVRISPRTRMLVLLGGALACGFATLVRYTNLAFVAPLALAAWQRDSEGRRHFSRALVAVLPAAIALTLVGLRNAFDFGSPFSDGYRYWVPELYSKRELVFSLVYLVKPLADLFAQGNLAAYGGALCGKESLLYAWPAAALALLGIGRNLLLFRRCPVARTLTYATFTTLPAILGFYLLYAWQDTRFLEPLLPLIASCAASGAIVARDLIASRPRLGGSLAALVALFAIVPGTLPRLEMQLRNDVVRDSLIDGLSAFAAITERDAVLIVDQPAALVFAVLPPSIELISVDLDLCDPHLSRVLRLGLSDRDGQRPACRTLSLGDRIDYETLAHLDDRLRAGVAVYRMKATFERIETPGEKELAHRYAVDPEASLTGSLPGPVSISRLLRRP